MNDEEASPRPGRSRTIPLAIAVAMLSIVVLAGLVPNTGTVTAASNCTYGSCPSSSSPFPAWAVATSIAIILLALLFLLLLLRRSRRRRPPAAEAPAGATGEPVPSSETWSEEHETPPAEWQESPESTPPGDTTPSSDEPAGDEPSSS